MTSLPDATERPRIPNVLAGRYASTELLAIWPTLLDKQLVDDHVRVTIEEVR